MLYWPVLFSALILCKILFRLQAKGRENIPSSGGFIIAANHTSFLDPVVLAVSCPRRLNFMARHDLFTIPLFGAFIRSVRAFPVRRDAADIAGLKEALNRLKKAGGLLVFPEGGRTEGEMSMRAESGIGFIAAKSRVPVVPAFIEGAAKALGRHARFIRPAKIRVYFGKPVYYNDAELKGSYEQFAVRVMQEIRRISENKGRSA
jgi:1-acyl-sn-glycerol-3-phosphate acyltransferase